jgi:G protein-coupled receptor 107
MAASPSLHAVAHRGPSLTALLFLVAAMVLVPPAAAEIRETAIRADPRSIIPLDEFGFSHSGVLELNVSGIAFDPQASAELDLSQLGFFLSTLDAWVHVLRQLQDLDVTCALQSELVKLAFSFDRLRPPSNPAGVEVARSSSFSTAFRVSEPGQYTLVFANCLGGGRDVRVTRARWVGNRGWVGAGGRARDPRRCLVAGRRESRLAPANRGVVRAGDGILGGRAGAAGVRGERGQSTDES